MDMRVRGASSSSPRASIRSTYVSGSGLRPPSVRSCLHMGSSERLTAWTALHAATLGAAAALGLSDEIGSFAPGCAADVCVWDWANGPVAARRHEVARGLHERVFAWMMLADERNLVASLVQGQVAFERRS